MRKSIGFCLVGLLAGGCSAREVGDISELVRHRDEPIMYGEPDTYHQAVVGLYNEVVHGTCTGTVIHKEGRTGYVLTAAHCVVDKSDRLVVPGRLRILFGNRMVSPTFSTYAQRVAMHPMYDGGKSCPNDFAMLQFEYATTDIPTIPVMQPAEDSVKEGTRLDIIGYGRTEHDTAGERRHIVKPVLAELAHWLVFDQSGTSGGMCSGDSGGPLITTDAAPKVASVVSFGQEGCVGYGFAGRVSQVYDSFIASFIRGEAGGASCRACHAKVAFSANAPCAAERAACQSSDDCKDHMYCVETCTDAECVARCRARYVLGYALYQALSTCACQDCSALCGSDPICATDSCGLALEPAECNTCANNACCDKEKACFEDSRCRGCAAAPSMSVCEKDALFQDYQTCLGDSCSAVCGVAPKDCELDFSDGQCTACVRDGCCALARQCREDEACAACVTEPSGAGCDALAPYTSLTTCMKEKCEESCASYFGSPGGDPEPDGGAEDVPEAGPAGPEKGSPSDGSAPQDVTHADSRVEESDDTQDDTRSANGCEYAAQPHGSRANVWWAAALALVTAWRRRRGARV